MCAEGEVRVVGVRVVIIFCGVFFYLVFLGC